MIVYLYHDGTPSTLKRAPLHRLKRLCLMYNIDIDTAQVQACSRLDNKAEQAAIVEVIQNFVSHITQCASCPTI